MQPPRPPRLFGASAGPRGNPKDLTPVTVTASATLLLAANSLRVMCALSNTGTATVYIGGPTVASGQGIPVAAGQTWVDDATQGAWYGVVATGTGTIAPLEVA
jgi:hypothetical protein